MLLYVILIIYTSGLDSHRRTTREQIVYTNVEKKRNIIKANSPAYIMYKLFMSGKCGIIIYTEVYEIRLLQIVYIIIKVYIAAEWRLNANNVFILAFTIHLLSSRARPGVNVFYVCTYTGTRREGFY